MTANRPAALCAPRLLPDHLFSPRRQKDLCETQIRSIAPLLQTLQRLLRDPNSVLWPSRPCDPASPSSPVLGPPPSLTGSGFSRSRLCIYCTSSWSPVPSSFSLEESPPQKGRPWSLYLQCHLQPPPGQHQAGCIFSFIWLPGGRYTAGAQ